MKISAEEKANATLIPLDRLLSDADDAEAAFDEFRESFNTGDEPGVVRAWELQIDERGNVGTTRMQTRLGSWPIDAYKFDELCAMIVDQYMEVGQPRMAVRLVGTRKEQTGYVFNKIVMLKRALKTESSSNGKESTATIMKLMQEMNEKNMAMIARLQTPVEKPDTMAEIQKMMAFAQAMNAPMMGMLQSLLPALAGRPAPAAGPDAFGNLGGLLDVAERLADLRGEGGGGGGADDSWSGILKAIVPLAKPALEALPALAAMQAARPAPAPILLPRPAPRPAAPPGTAPTPPPAPAAGNPVQLTDLPSGDSAMLAQMKPQIDTLVTIAQSGSDAVGAADLIFEQVFLDPRLSEDDYSRLADFIDSEKFVSYVTIMNPAAKPLAAWFEAFKIQIIQRLSAEDAADELGTQPAAAPGAPDVSLAKPN